MLSNDVIITIAQAIIANANVLQSLVDHLPVETKEAVASVVTPAPAAQVVKPKKEPVVPNVTPAPTPVVPVMVTPTPVVPVVPEPVVASPSNVMPPPPVFTQLAPAPVQAGTTAAAAPFSDPKGLLAYVIASYNALGAQKGAGIQQVLVANGYQNINDVQPDHYAALYAGIEALKV